MVTIRTEVKKPERKITQKKDMPNSDPALAIVVTLPVPILYPIKNKPGPIALNPSSIFRIIFFDIFMLIKINYRVRTRSTKERYKFINHFNTPHYKHVINIYHHHPFFIYGLYF